MSKRLLSSAEQQAIIERARACCEYCQSQMNYSGQSFEFDHIKPLSEAGETTLANMALACGGCNRHKSNKSQHADPLTEEAVALFNPRAQAWANHFTWNADYTEVIGLTAVGRATVEALKLNRVGLVNMRQVLCMAGKHPPY